MLITGCDVEIVFPVIIFRCYDDHNLSSGQDLKVRAVDFSAPVGPQVSQDSQDEKVRSKFKIEVGAKSLTYKHS
jgi:hypothetical protein